MAEEKECVTKTDCAYNKDQCYKFNIAPMMKKNDALMDKMERILIELSALPGKINEQMDVKIKLLETRIDALETKMEQRTFEWLKYIIMALAGAAISVVISKMK